MGNTGCVDTIYQTEMSFGFVKDLMEEDHLFPFSVKAYFMWSMVNPEICMQSAPMESVM